MHRRIACMMLIAITTSVLVVIGCGDSHPPVDSSLTEATVKGVVKLKGKPAVGGGTVMFNPSNVDRKVAAATTEIKEDGSYSLKTYTGGNEVKFSGPFIKEERGLALTTPVLRARSPGKISSISTCSARMIAPAARSILKLRKKALAARK